MAPPLLSSAGTMSAPITLPGGPLLDEEPPDRRADRRLHGNRGGRRSLPVGLVPPVCRAGKIFRNIEKGEAGKLPGRSTTLRRGFQDTPSPDQAGGGKPGSFRCPVRKRIADAAWPGHRYCDSDLPHPGRTGFRAGTLDIANRAWKSRNIICPGIVFEEGRTINRESG